MKQGDLSLEVLSQRVRDSRASVVRCRRGPVNSPDVIEARRRLLSDLENYVSALESNGFPVPQSLRSELALNRRLSETPGW